MLRRIRSYYTKKLTENEELRSKLPPFTIDQQYNVYYITKLTSRTTMDYLINIISSTTTIIVDTETDDQSHEPALIQIKPVVQPPATLPVILLEALWLPSSTSSHRKKVEQLCAAVFCTKNTIYGWGDVRKELRQFRHHDLFSTSNIIEPVDVQKEYRRYYNEKHPHEQRCPSRYQDTDDAATFTLNAPDDDIDLDPHADHVACTCPFRPYKDPKNVTAWSLQKGIKYEFNQFLDKKLTRSDWRGGIDRELGTWEFPDRRIRDDQRQIRRDLQQYAINDVLAVLAIIRERDRYKQLNNRRKVSTINLAPSPPEQLMDYENPPEAKLQPQQRISALVCESISITGMEMSRIVHVDEPLVSVLPSHCLKTQVPTRPKRLRRKPRRRSEKSRLNSNKKASKRHRKTDFKYELVKPIDPQFHPTQVRRIRHSLNLKYRRIIIKDNRLCIGLKNEESREGFNRRIPPFLFTAEHYRQLNGPPQTSPHPQELPKPLELPDQQ
ncbi:unnamed protein product [Didymodactylos carnosus]|uniref:Uncharacterized protein n=1 Tax=Didymodactylos carnosus TaxID=1234261 RepID=A0A814IK76_9BILA|nr:unnamed protein product [Didymodactylos carnosus]CAF3795910.1 unnamed protein product [Didymodactylos carnosus]